MANRLGLIVHKIIADTHTAFIKDRFIMERIVIIWVNWAITYIKCRKLKAWEISIVTR
jgi:hypothetical protein